MTFPTPYQQLPKDVKLLLSDKKTVVKLSMEAEEMATWWAEVEVQEFGLKEIVRRNFWAEFRKRLENSEHRARIHELSDLDFSHIRSHLEKVKEEKRNRPNELKKKEAEERAKVNGAFQFCLFDGSVEKVANYNIEPPGIFRGRGEHPHMGKIKSRVVPEYVTINTGHDDPIPPCPIAGHNWKRIVSNTECTWLCNFRDEKNTYMSTRKYLFLAAESRIKGENDRNKYERARRLKDKIQEIRAAYEKDMVQTAHFDRNQLGVATYLIDKLALRVGNEKGEDEADTVGCCSLRVEHITLNEERQEVTFDFLGKDSMRYLNTVPVTPPVFKLLQRFKKVVKEGRLVDKGPKDDLFEQINASKLNDYLKQHMNDLSAKVFRTYNASVTLQTQLEGSETAKRVGRDTNVDSKVKFYNDCNREVALLCNHKKAESKNLKDQLKRLEDLIGEKRKEVKQLQAHLKKLEGGGKEGAGKEGAKTAASKRKAKASEKEEAELPKSGEAVKSKLKKLGEQIKQKTLELEGKRQNAEVALGTSKINYMDPRITISWCKQQEVPIEKIFPKTLRNKFAWAMDNQLEWKF
uniref:DNA topoisomerase I n=1 Tax=Strombidium rassoulzadegani TaxID=1082188 RepID=A0A7S3CR17_9SPIT|mmetsp:Transcript_2582/g.4330  ORF Transcript_2582/g.4330 Transcript_2582/m.4330 type:complete len:577 (+) Transcript_2582:147-1877(+)